MIYEVAAAKEVSDLLSDNRSENYRTPKTCYADQMEQLSGWWETFSKTDA